MREYPSELLRFAPCEDVPLPRRRNLVVAVFLYMRDGELRELRWEDVDLEHAVVNVHHAYNRRTKQSKTTKTGNTRRVPIHEHLLPLLRAMHAEANGDGLVLALPSERTMARSLRRWLRRAGVTRDELFEASPTRKPLIWHDGRATGITWAAVEGVDPTKIQRRAGHTTMRPRWGTSAKRRALWARRSVRRSPNCRSNSCGRTRPPPRPRVPRKRGRDRLAGWTGLEREAVRGIEGVSAGYRGVASAEEDGKAADTPPIHDTLDHCLDQSRAVDVALAQALAQAAAVGRYDVVLQLARRLEARPVRAPSRVHAEDDLAVAVRLAAEAGEWAVVATRSRPLDALRRERQGGGLKAIKGGSGASGSGER